MLIRSSRSAVASGPVWAAAAAFAVAVAFLGSVTRADSVESTAGAVIDGKVVARDDKAVTLEVQVGGKPVQRKFPLTLVRAITVAGKREVLGPGGASAPAAGDAPVSRTRPEVEALITKAAADPDWLAATPLNLPKSLDLKWPEKPEGGWNNQKNVGQFIWDVINPNPGRWREGIKLMHHLMDTHKGDAAIRQRAAGTLGSMYHHLFLDYARAVHWWRQAGTHQDPIGLAECYWKLGNKPMAVGLMSGMTRIRPAAIKLWADMGETERALKLVDLFAGSAGVDEAYLYAADACRLAGRFADALKYYDKIAALPDDKGNKRSKDRARAAVEAIRLFDTFDPKKVADGTYTASSLGYEGQVEIAVRVAGGRIEDVRVTKHKEKQFYASMTDTPANIIRKQSVKGVDATSRATITSEAIIHATAKALQSNPAK
ncbi:MAG: FMN-binding protein [Phycisphaerae bacterium]|nr:FMN-binding protein [Tepidisphaeraceae bacterium]